MTTDINSISVMVVSARNPTYLLSRLQNSDITDALRLQLKGSSKTSWPSTRYHHIELRHLFSHTLYN